MKSNEEFSPTIMSLQDTIDLLERKNGKNWREDPACVCVVIWASKAFDSSHVKEIVPDLFDLCEEFREKNTINGKPLPENFYMLAFHMAGL